MRKPALLVATGCVALLALAACAPHANPMVHQVVAGRELAGFWLGLWHGIVIWVTFVVSLFDHSVSIYEVHNSGWPYDLGFTIGAALLHGSGVAASRRRARRPSVVVGASVDAGSVTPAAVDG